MSKGKDFYGKDIAEVIEQACKDLDASREDLDIEVLETGSAGIFGLCKKKAHIRVRRKAVTMLETVTAETQPEVDAEESARHAPVEPDKATATVAPARQEPEEAAIPAAAEAPAPITVEKAPAPAEIDEEDQAGDGEDFEENVPVEPPSAEALAAIQNDLHRLLTLMGLPSEVHITFGDNTVQCTISGPHEDHIVGPEGRTLDSLQYLLRKMVARHLPDRVMLALNAGDFRERRTEELKVRAAELANLVRTDGKTRAIPALNPSERRVVHMVLQEDKSVRSRSVGDGLFKKVLIYKPGKGRRPIPKKRRGGGQGGRSSGE